MDVKTLNEQGWRKAHQVYLQDVQITIAAEGTDPWAWDNFDMQTWSVVGLDVLALLNTLGLNNISGLTAEIKGQKYRCVVFEEALPPEPTKLSVRTESTVYGEADNSVTVEILARVIGPGLLDLIVTRKNSVDTWSERITYSGRFTVMWDTEGM